MQHKRIALLDPDRSIEVLDISKAKQDIDVKKPEEQHMLGSWLHGSRLINIHM